MNEILYNPIIPAPYATLKKSNAELGSHRFAVRGGRYSGKTTTVFEEALEGWITIKGAHIVLARYDDCDFRKTSFTGIKKALMKFGISPYCIIPKRVGDIVFKPLGNIIRFQAIGGDEHRTKGLEFEFGYVHRYIVDEAQELEEEYEVRGAEKTLLRFMGPTTKWIYIYNPPPLKGEFANRYFPAQVKAKRAIEIYSSYKDIYKLLYPEVKEEIRKDKAQDFDYYRYEYLGEVVAAKGLVYPQLRRDKHIITIYDLMRTGDRVSELIFGLDEGTCNDSTCVTPLAIMFSGKAVVLDCFENDPLISGQQSPAQQSRAIWDFLRGLIERFPFLNYTKRRWIFESAEGGQMLRLQFMEDTGEECYLVKNKNVLGDVKRVRSMLSEGILFFHVDNQNHTMNLVEDMENYIFDEKTNKIKPQQRDDTIDSLEYATKLYYDAPTGGING